mgnify:CR=1 FL=1
MPACRGPSIEPGDAEAFVVERLLPLAAWSFPDRFDGGAGRHLASVERAYGAWCGWLPLRGRRPIGQVDEPSWRRPGAGACPGGGLSHAYRRPDADARRR